MRLRVILVLCLQSALLSCKRPPPPVAAVDAGAAAAPTAVAVAPTAARTVWATAWRETEPLKLPRAGVAAAIHGGFIYVLGGVAGRGAMDFTATTEFAQLQADGSVGPWRPGPSMNEARGFFEAVVHDGHLYVVGGANGENGHVLLRTVERAPLLPDGSLGPWQKERYEMNMPRRCSKAVLVGKTIFAIGGFGGDMLNTVEHAAFLPDGGLDEWFEEDGKLTVLRYISGVKHVGDFTYVVGGHHQEAGVGIKDVELARVLDAAGYDKWRKTTPMSVGRYGLAVAEHGGRLYAFGGITGVEYLDSIESARIRPDGELGSWCTQDEVDAWKRELAAGPAGEQPLPNEGVVVKAMRAQQYVYLLVKGKAGEEWLAAPGAEYRPGDRVSYAQGVLMQDFYSKELGLSFPAVQFVGAVKKLPESR